MGAGSVLVTATVPLWWQRIKQKPQPAGVPFVSA